MPGGGLLIKPGTRMRCKDNDDQEEAVEGAAPAYSSTKGAADMHSAAAADDGYVPDNGPEASQGAASDQAGQDDVMQDQDDDQEEAVEDAAPRLPRYKPKPARQMKYAPVVGDACVCAPCLPTGYAEHMSMQGICVLQRIQLMSAGSALRPECHVQQRLHMSVLITLLQQEDSMQAWPEIE